MLFFRRHFVWTWNEARFWLDGETSVWWVWLVGNGTGEHGNYMKLPLQLHVEWLGPKKQFTELPWVRVTSLNLLWGFDPFEVR